MRIHKGNLVKRIKGYMPAHEPWYDKPGLVLCNPYEDVISITDTPIQVTSLVLVCDIVIDGTVYSKIPVEHLEKVNPQGL